MAPTAFVDTNVLVYSIDADEPRKRGVARAVLEREAGRLAISSQVLGEFFWVATRRLRRPLARERAAELVERFSRIPTVAIDGGLVRSAIAIADGAQIAYWDALIVAAAASAGCERLLSEDLADGRTIAGVRVENPFAGPPARPQVG